MEFIRELEAAGAMDEIYAAIDTHDMAKIVSMATNALKKVNSMGPKIKITKSKCDSTFALHTAVKMFEAGINNRVVHFINKALTLAPKGSKEMMLAYGVRAETMYSFQNYTACQEDIKTCLSMNAIKDYAKILKEISKDCKTMNMLQLLKPRNTSSFISTFFQFDCKRNAVVPCTSADVIFTNQGGEKRVTADIDIKAGAVVAIERAFDSCVALENKYLTCYYCHKMTPSLHACDGCCEALFCNVKCRDKCMNEYHRIECQIMDYLSLIYSIPLNALVTRTTIKLSLKLGWDALVKESDNIGASRMKTASIRETYNSAEPLSMLSYDDEKIWFEGKMFKSSIHCARILNSLDKVPNYLPTLPSKRKAAKEALSRIMLKLYVTFTNTVPITCTAMMYGSFGELYKLKEHRNYGWFSMSSKLKHSCEPNLTVVGLNDSVALVALRTIKKGEELTISYIEHYYSDSAEKCLQTPHRRATKLFMTIGHVCEDCRVCEEDWDANSNDIPTVITLQQYYLIAIKKRNNDAEEKYMITCKSLDVFPVRTSDHKLAYKEMEYLLDFVKYDHTKTY